MSLSPHSPLPPPQILHSALASGPFGDVQAGNKYFHKLGSTFESELQQGKDEVSIAFIFGIYFMTCKGDM